LFVELLKFQSSQAFESRLLVIAQKSQILVELVYCGHVPFRLSYWVIFLLRRDVARLLASAAVAHSDRKVIEEITADRHFIAEVMVLPGVMGLEGDGEQVVHRRFPSSGLRGRWLAATEQFLAVGPQCPLWRDVPVERLAGYAELLAELADLGLGLAHRRHREPELGSGHLVGPAAVAAPGARGGHSRAGAFDDQLTLELGILRRTA
jgi:hypothetical protein